MRRSNKKGFTIVELVIVIAVIAVLAAVMIPTFTSLTNDAKENARDQEAKNALTTYLIDNDADTTGVKAVVVKENGKYYVYEVTNGNITVEGDVESDDNLDDYESNCNPDKADKKDGVFVIKKACADANKDHACDACGETVGAYAAKGGENNSTDCSYCNKAISGEGKCPVYVAPAPDDNQ